MIGVVHFYGVWASLAFALHQCLVLIALYDILEQAKIYDACKVNSLEIYDISDFPHCGLLAKILLNQRNPAIDWNYAKYL